MMGFGWLFGHTMALLCLIASFAVGGCVSSRPVKSDSAVLNETSPVGQGNGGILPGLIPADVLSQRLRQVRQRPVEGAVAVAEKDKSEIRSVPKPPSLEAGFQLWLRAEQWNTVLFETDSPWLRCRKVGEQSTSGCQQIGRARAIALVKLGSIEAAWNIFEELASANNESNTLFFAELLSQHGSFQLCSDLARIALGNAAGSDREDLYALNVRCLRRAGFLAESRRAAQVALQELPESKKVNVELAMTQLSENNLTQGCGLLEKLFSDNVLNVAVVYNWGQCLVRRRDSESALSVLMLGEREWPSEREWLILSGEIARLDGQIELARERGLDYLSGTHSSDEFRIQAENLAGM